MLNPVSRQRVLSFAEGLPTEPWNVLIAVTLVDGETIIGHIGGYWSRPRDVFMGDSLIVSNRDRWTELRCYIPLADIAGVRTVNIRQRTYPSENRYMFNFPEDERALRLAIRQRRQEEIDRLTKEWKPPKDVTIIDSTSEQAVNSTGNSRVSNYISYELRDLDVAVLCRLLIPVLRGAALRTAMRHNYRVEREALGISYLITGEATFAGDLDPKDGERLYVDWDYVTRNRKRLNGAGFGFIVSLSLQWETSDSGAAKRLAKRPLTSLTNVCAVDFALVRGYVAFFDVRGSAIEEGVGSSARRKSMDGGTWRAAVIGPDPIVKSPSSDAPWVFSYWREGSEEVPFELLDSSVRPLDIFGTVHTGKSVTRFGTADCFLKVHYAQAAKGWHEPGLWPPLSGFSPL